MERVKEGTLSHLEIFKRTLNSPPNGENGRDDQVKELLMDLDLQGHALKKLLGDEYPPVMWHNATEALTMDVNSVKVPAVCDS